MAYPMYPEKRVYTLSGAIHMALFIILAVTCFGCLMYVETSDIVRIQDTIGRVQAKSGFEYSLYWYLAPAADSINLYISASSHDSGYDISKANGLAPDDSNPVVIMKTYPIAKGNVDTNRLSGMINTDLSLLKQVKPVIGEFELKRVPMQYFHMDALTSFLSILSYNPLAMAIQFMGIVFILAFYCQRKYTASVLLSVVLFATFYMEMHYVYGHPYIASIWRSL